MERVKNGRRAILKWFRGSFVCLIHPPPPLSFWAEFPVVTQADLTLSTILRVDPELRILLPPPLDY